MYLHKKTYELRYTDVDFCDRLKLSSLLSLMEQSACLSADELHFGYADIAPKNIGFILSNWYIELSRDILLGEELTVTTWPVKPQRLLVFRDFEFFVGEEKVGVATTRWCLVDLNSFSLVPSSRVFGEKDEREYNSFRSVDFSAWKIIPPQNAELGGSKRIVCSDYDHYNHVNNTKYADFVSDVFSPEFLRFKRLRSGQMTYVKQCKYGEKLDFFTSTEGEYTYVEGKCGEETRVLFKGQFVDV